MAKIGYARISASDQNMARQLEQLKHVDKLFRRLSVEQAKTVHNYKLCWSISEKGI